MMLIHLEQPFKQTQSFFRKKKHMGVEPKIGGKPPKWMVYSGKSYEQMDDLGVPLFLEIPIYTIITKLLYICTCHEVSLCPFIYVSRRRFPTLLFALTR